ncbi:MAG TPA: response regulator [Polyangia bacterium]|nr:response regulator [Polyangia bacterium]
MSGAGRTILLVEDDPDVRDSLQDILEDEGFDVVPASNGKQAIDFLTLNDPPGADLVILDLLMPMVSGWEVLQRMSVEARLAGVPVIVLSAMATPRPPRAQGFVRKPFSVDAFVGEVRSVLAAGAADPAPAPAP